MADLRPPLSPPRSLCRGVVAVLVAGALAGASSAWAGTADTRAPKPVERLWSEYPLNPERGQAEPSGSSGTERSPPAARARPVSVRPAAQRSDPDGSTWWPFAAALGVAALGIAAATAMTHRRTSVALRPAGGPPMADLFRRNRREPDGGDDAPSTPEVDGDDGTTTDRIQRYAAVSSEPAAESAHAASRAQPERPPAANVGTHVNQVLEAAEKAARDLVEQAEREAARRRAAAEADVVALRAAATAEADEAREQAVSVRTEAEREADERRRSADEYAAARRSEADSEAEQVVAAARSEAAELGRAEAERHRVLQENVEVAETRLRELVGGLRGIADRLEVLVDGNAATRSPDSEREDELAESLIAQAATPRRATRGGRDRT